MTTELSAFYGILGAAIGAPVGAYVGYQLSGPCLRVNFAGVRLKGVFPNPEELLKRPELLLTTPRVRSSQKVRDACDESDWVGGIRPYYNLPAQYVEELISRRRRNELAREVSARHPEIVTELLSYLNTGQLDKFYALWADEQDILWSVLEGEHARGRFDLDVQEMPTQNAVYSVMTDKDGDFLVPLGRQNLLFIWTRREAQLERTKVFAEKVARVFAYRDIDLLRTIVQFLSRVQRREEVFDRLEKILGEELDSYRQVVARAVLANSGRSPVTVDEKIRFVLKARGQRFIDPRTQRQVVLEDDMKLNLHALDEDQLPKRQPITIPAGGAFSLEAASSDPLVTLKERNAIENLYGTSTRCHLQFRRFDLPRPLLSNEIYFGPPAF